MFRAMQLSVSPQHTEDVIQSIRSLDGLFALRLQKGICLEPPGDSISLELTSNAVPRLMHLLDEKGLVRSGKVSFSISEPVGLVSDQASKQIGADGSEATWEEMEGMISKESNMTWNAILLMAIAGAVAAIGIATNALHLVIGAMVIAPGFEPIVRIGLGIASGSGTWKVGLIHTLKGFTAMILAAALTSFVLVASGHSPLGHDASYLPVGVLISYWTQVTETSVTVSILAGVAGALLIATHRSVLTAGVMIALALVPSATLVGMGIASGQFQVAIAGVWRWILEVALILISSIGVLLWKQVSLQKRTMFFSRRTLRKS